MRSLIVVLVLGWGLAAGAAEFEVLSEGDELAGWTVLGGDWSIAGG